MKKILILIAIFTFGIGFSADAQAKSKRIKIAKKQQALNTDYEKSRDYYDKKVIKRKRNKYKKAQNSRIKSMRKVAKADGVITLDEKLAMKREKKQMRMKNKNGKRGKNLPKAEKRKVSRIMK